MFNLYKHNLSVLSNLNNSNLIYYDDDNKLYIEDRLFTFIRGKNDIKKILTIIISSFYKYYYNISLLKNSIDSIPKHKNIEIISNEDIIIDLLKKSLNGLKIYRTTINTYKIESSIDNVIEEFEKCLLTLNISLDNFKEIKLENSEIDNINPLQEQKLEEKTEQNDIKINIINENKASKKSENSNEIPEIVYGEEQSSIVSRLSPPNYYNNNINNENIKDEPKNKKKIYIFGIIYIIGRKIANVVKYIGNKICSLF